MTTGRVGFVRTFLLLCCMSLCVTTRQQVNATTTQRYTRTQEDPLLCLLSVNVVMNQDDTHQEFYACSLLLEQEFAEGIYAIDLPPNVFEQETEALLKRGQEIYLEIMGGQVTDDTVLLPPTAAIHVLPGRPPKRQENRRLARNPNSVGSFRAIMIRISTEDSEPTFTKDELYSYLFTENLSVKNQFELCSGDALTMEPDAVLGGVINVNLATTTTGKTNKSLMNLAEARVNNDYSQILGGQSIRDHTDALLFVVPPGTGPWAAFATVSGKSSAYNDKWGGYLGAVMHELGHNLGLRHAFENGKEYEDRSGYMGSAPQRTLFPQRCFNGHNFQRLKWYNDRFLKVEPEIPQLVKMAGFVDYSKTRQDEYIVVQVGDLFLHYNRVDTFNIDSAEMQDSLIVVRERSDGTDRLNGLKAGTSHSEYIDGEEVTIQVCNVVDARNNRAEHMVVSIGYGDSLCGPMADPIAANPQPTRNPTSRPTPRPTPRPTWRPTPRPTPQPTLQPTLQPTERPKPQTVPTPPVPAPTLAPIPNEPIQTPQPPPSPQSPPTPRPTSTPTKPWRPQPPNNINGRQPPSPGGMDSSAPNLSSAEKSSPAPSMVTNENGKYTEPNLPSGMYNRGDDYNGILIPAESESHNNSFKAGATIGFVIGILLFGCGCCLLLSHRYRIVWDDSHEDEILEVRGELGVVKRGSSFNKKAETETLASEDCSEAALATWENLHDEKTRRRGRSPCRRPPKQMSRMQESSQAKSSKEEDYDQAVNLWTQPPQRHASPTTSQEGSQPSLSSSPPRCSTSGSPSRQSFQPVIVPKKPRQKQWFDLEMHPVESATIEAAPTSPPPQPPSLPSSPSRFEYPNILPASESFDSAYDFTNVIPDEQGRKNASMGPNDWMVY